MLSNPAVHTHHRQALIFLANFGQMNKMLENYYFLKYSLLKVCRTHHRCQKLGLSWPEGQHFSICSSVRLKAVWNSTEQSVPITQLLVWEFERELWVELGYFVGKQRKQKGFGHWSEKHLMMRGQRLGDAKSAVMEMEWNPARPWAVAMLLLWEQFAARVHPPWSELQTGQMPPEQGKSALQAGGLMPTTGDVIEKWRSLTDKAFQISQNATLAKKFWVSQSKSITCV